MLEAIIIIIAIVAFIIGISWKQRRPCSDQKLQELKVKVSPLDPKISDFNFYTDPSGSYILGDRDVYICVLNEQGDYYDDNFLIYVILHELTHGLIPSDTRDHPPLFDSTFEEIKNRAIRLGIYNPTIPFPSTYCNKPIAKYHD